MAETALIRSKNSPHNVPALIDAAQTSLTDLARVSLRISCNGPASFQCGFDEPEWLRYLGQPVT
jgi:hypothetical protein